MSRTPLMRMLRRAIAQSEHSATRRSFLRTTAIAAAVATAPSMIVQSCANAASAKVDRTMKVAVVGAGLAGLHATWLLHQSNVQVELFEGSKRIGGRAFTGNNVVVEGSTAELGGEWIDTNHSDIHSLAKRFGVELIDKKSGESTEMESFYFEGNSYSMKDVVSAITPFLPKIIADVERLPEDFRDLPKSPAKELDYMPMDTYIDSLGITGWLRSLIDIAYLTEYGLEMNQQSAINFIALVGTDVSSGELSFFGESDEKYVLKGGIQGITSGLHKAIESNTHLNHRLSEISQENGQYLLTFLTEKEPVTVSAEHVVIAIPFTMLRSVKINVDLPEKKRRAIDELAYGTNGKVLFGFTERFWSKKNYSGSIMTDLPLQLVWENCHVPNPKGTGLTMFYGGKTANLIKEMSDTDLTALFKKSLQQIWDLSEVPSPIRMLRMHWPSQPFVKASYSCFGPGQWTEFYGVMGESVGNLHFAGEHCSLDHMGYLNGGAETGRLAAEQILKTM